MKHLKFKFASKYQSRRFPQMGFSSVAYKEDAAADTAADTSALTTERLLKELGTIKGALETSLKKEAKEQEKNLDEKLLAVNKAIEDLKAVKPEVTAAELSEIQRKLDITIGALDVVQTRQKSQSMNKGGNQGQQEDISFPGQIKAMLTARKEDITKGALISLVGKPIEQQGMTLKAVGDMTVIGNVNTGVVPNSYRTGFVLPPTENIHLRSLVAVTPSDTDSYHFFRFNVGEGSISYQGNENGTKAQIDEDLSEQVVNLDYLAGFLRISKKLLRNFNGLQATLSRWLPEQYYQAEDTKGYQTLISAATGITNTDTGGGMIRQIIRTIGAQKKARYNVNGIVVDGAVWANILTYTTTAGEYNQPMVVSMRPDGTLMIAGIPVYTASWVGGDEAIIGDWRYFEIIQSESLAVGFFEQDVDNVQKNKVTVRIEASVGFAVLDPRAFSVLSLESVS